MNQNSHLMKRVESAAGVGAVPFQGVANRSYTDLPLPYAELTDSASCQGRSVDRPYPLMASDKPTRAHPKK